MPPPPGSQSVVGWWWCNDVYTEGKVYEEGLAAVVL